MHSRERLAPLVRLLLLTALAGALSGCHLFAPDDAPSSDAGADGGDPGGGPWTLALATDRIELGAWLWLEVSGVRDSEGPVMLHIEGHEAPYPILSARRVAAEASGADAGVDSEDAGVDDAPERWSLVTVLPVREGVYRFALGDDQMPMTTWHAIEVVAPTRRLAPAEVASAMQGGLGAMVADTRAMLDGTDAETRAAMAELVTSEERAAFEGALAELDQVAAAVATDYAAMSPEDERLVQALYVNTGLYDAMIASRDGEMARALDIRSIPFVDRLAAYANRPMQALLFTLDTFSFLLSALGMVCDVVEIVGAITGVGLPAAATAVGTKLVVAFLKIALETFLPVDLLEIAVHGQPRLFHGEGARFLHWGKFAPQNATGSTVRSLEDLVLLGIAEAVPSGAALPARMLATRVVQSARATVRYILERVPGAVTEAFLNTTFPDNIRATGLYTPIDLRVYRLRLSEVLLLVPLAGWLVSGTLSAFWDPALVDPLVSTQVSPPAWGRSSRLVVDYAIVDIAVQGLAYPGAMPVETAFMNLESSAWHFGQIGSWDNIIQVPWPETVTYRHEPIAVQSIPRMDADERLSDEHIVFDRLFLPDGSTQSYVTRDTPRTRIYEMVFTDEAGFSPDNTTVTVLVNGTAAISDMRIVNGAPVPVSFQPGLNEIQIVAGEPEAIACGSLSRHWCVEVGFPRAINADVSRDVDLEAGGTFSFHVWTPPELR
jgi:hypothetical protein